MQLPSDRRRQRFNLLLLGATSRPLAFVKFIINQSRPTALRAQKDLTDNAPKSFWCPRLLHHGHLAGWSFTVLSPMPQCRHAPARLNGDQRRVVVQELQRLLASSLELSDGDVPVHGDFGPWNVRRLADGRLAVIDWEEVTSGPAAADEVWHCTTSGLVRGWSPDRVTHYTRAELAHHAKVELARAARFWLERLARPEPTEVLVGLARPHRTDHFLAGQVAVLERVAQQD